MIFGVEGVPPSENKLRRMHWSARRRIKQKWKLLLLERLLPQKEIKKYKTVKVIGYHKRLYDYDNFVGACKGAIIDNLRDIGLIAGDAPSQVKIYYGQVKSPEAKTLIMLDKSE